MVKNQKGFALLESLLILLVLFMLSFVGWFVWHAKSQADKSLDSASSANFGNISKNKKGSTDSVSTSNDTSASFTPDNSNYSGSSPDLEKIPNNGKYLIVREWGVKVALADADIVGYSVHAGDPSDASSSIINFTVNNIDGECSELGMHIQRAKSDGLKNYLLNDGQPINGFYYAVYGDQAGCETFPIRDRIAQEIATADIVKL